jgi:glucose/arabinose dehydrogenase
MTRQARLQVRRLEDRTTPANLPTGFDEAAVATGLTDATAMEIAPNGDLWVLEQAGVVKRFRPGSTTADVVGNLSGLGLDSNGERGLLGIAFDPQYATNKFVYFYYTATSPTTHNRISRFTVDDANAADYNLVGTGGVPTRTVVFDLDSLSGATNHNGGAIHFGPDGKLYAAAGDNADGTHSQSLTTVLGKVLRINADGTIPTDNPFFASTTNNNRAIWALGLRNPYTFAFQPGTGRMFINDVGQNTWEEINDGLAGSNYGWPNTEGNAGTPPSSPGTYRAPLYTYSHGSGTFQGFAITGGAFYNPATANFPSSYAGDYFFADFVNSWIHVRDGATGTVDSFATQAGGPVDLRVTADGSLLYLARNTGSVFRVRFATPVNNDISVVPGLKAEFFDFTTNLTQLPDLTGLSPTVVRTDARVYYPQTTGVWQGLDSRFADTFAVRETGYLNVPRAGTYTLSVASNDGSRVWLDGQQVIDNDGVHAMRTRSATLTLAAGNHALRVESFENVGGAGLALVWSGPGIARQVVPAARLFQDAPDGSLAFRQETDPLGARVAMEAEHFDGKVSERGKSWTHFAAVAGFSGTGAMQATPNTGLVRDTGYVANSPRLDYRINFTQTGTYYVWVRGRAATTGDDTLHVGLDGAAVATADRISGLKNVYGTGTLTRRYDWTNSTLDGARATIEITTPGIHTLNVWMREDGAVIDELLLLSNPDIAPTAPGQTESPRDSATVNFASGFANATGLTTNGFAAVSGSAIRLTDGGTSEAGSVFTSNQVNVSRFATTFDFQLTSAAADGFAFVIQGVGNTALGQSGGGLGYQGIGSSAAIKFDLSDNAGEGNNSTGLYTNGAAPTGRAIDLNPTGIDLHSGHVFRASLDYNGSQLFVTIRDLTTGASATQTYTVNLPSLVGGSTAYVGFTGGTGGLTAVQDVLNWSYWA